MSIVVEAKGLVKKYGDKKVVDGIDLEIKQGEIFGLLGPNGAGKSSTMKMMYCSTSITNGELYILGLNAKKNNREIKSRIGIIPQLDGLDSQFTSYENLMLFASYHRIPLQRAEKRAEELIRMMKLDEERDKFTNLLSGGMRRRLAIARGMINNPELLFLDEPTAGLDPDVRFWIWDFLKNMISEMGTVVLTTHYMEEAEKLCHRIAIMDKGKILTIGEPKKLIEEHVGLQVVELEVSQKDMVYYTTRLKAQQYLYQVVGNNINVHLKDKQDPQAVLQLVHSKNISIRQSNLNDVFLKVAGHALQRDFNE